VVDFVSLITLQGRSRNNALRATRRLRRDRHDAAEAQRAVDVAADEATPSRAALVADPVSATR
jgi:hypothetical protein